MDGPVDVAILRVHLYVYYKSTRASDEPSLWMIHIAASLLFSANTFSTCFHAQRIIHFS